MLLVALLAPLAAAAIAAGVGWRPWVGWAGTLAAAVVTADGAGLAVQVVDRGPVTGLGGLLRADALSAFMLIVIGLVSFLATWFGIGYLQAELADGHTTPAGARLYAVLVELFIAAMVLAVLADNLGVMWVAVEATTIATAFLVGHRRTRASLEASWKYVVIGSVGVALAFLGTVLVYFASRHAPGLTAATLDWTTLVAGAGHLNPGVMRLAAGLLVLGYGTKVGLAPMHTWLPDAHSQAPAPVSALMSGVLLSVAFYALLRYKVIVDGALGPGFMRGLLVAAGLLSLAVAASLLVAQRDYKRMLAYSSIEHMGLIALGAAAGNPLAMAAVLLHILGHGLAKSVLFLGSGEILRTEGTTEIAGVRGLLASRPLLGGSFGLGLLALLGLPPFSLFASEVGIARAGLQAGLGWAVAVALVLLLVIFAAIFSHGQRMLLGEPANHAEAHAASWLAATPIVGGLLLAAGLGVSVWPIERLLHAAAAIVGRP
jgi:hydrogenase-4 component F